MGLFRSKEIGVCEINNNKPCTYCDYYEKGGCRHLHARQERPLWMKQLPDDLKDNGVLSQFSSITTIARAYLKLVGAITVK